MRIGYTFVIADVFHYGILQLLETASKACDRFICGVLTDDAVRKARGNPICSYEERSAVIAALRQVDSVVPQDSQDPTDNIKAIREEYPDAEIVFVYGNNWKATPGGAYLDSINAQTIQQDFYERLSNENISYKTARSILPDNSVLETFTAGFSMQDFESFRPSPHKVVITSKARTLQALKPILTQFSIEKTFVFAVSEWSDFSEEIIGKIQEPFAGEPIVVRSSSLNEDTAERSMAGFFDSVIGVDSTDPVAITNAVEQVVAAYDKDDNATDLNQVLVQRQTLDVAASGTLFTQDLETNAPYYVINYDDSGSTDTVTSGKGGRLLRIYRGAPADTIPEQWASLLEAVRELESVIPDFPLDIEFAVTNSGRRVLFQVRPLAANAKVSTVDQHEIGRQIQEARETYARVQAETGGTEDADLILSDMIFWNPAELIGHRPSPLAASIFDRLVMCDAWNQGIAMLGYRRIYPSRLMHMVLYKPYINANKAFLASIPQAVPEKLVPRLMDFYLDKLKANPHLHDKAEFDIMFPNWDCSLHDRLQELGEAGWTQAEIAELEDVLATFTRGTIARSSSYLDKLEKELDAMDQRKVNALQRNTEKVLRQRLLLPVDAILSQCEEKGLIPFSAAARLGFMAESLLRSLEATGVISADERQVIYGSISTVASELAQAMYLCGSGQISRDDFMHQYGHLRAGTYDILTPRYDSFSGMEWLEGAQRPASKTIIPDELKQRIDAALRESALNIGFDQFYDFAQTWLAARERFKLRFTRLISDSLEIIRSVAQDCDIVPSDIANLSLDDIMSVYSLSESALRDRMAIGARKRACHVQMPPLLTGPDDLYKLDYLESHPNFITTRTAEGPPLLLQGASGSIELDLAKKIVFIENADPGYHWIFSHNIAGLITKYGGAASHMAICCAEFGIPAAIGCGVKFDTLASAETVRLDCANNQLIARKQV